MPEDWRDIWGVLPEIPLYIAEVGAGDVAPFRNPTLCPWIEMFRTDVGIDNPRVESTVEHSRLLRGSLVIDSIAIAGTLRLKYYFIVGV
jgi:hypothetical protein